MISFPLVDRKLIFPNLLVGTSIMFVFLEPYFCNTDEMALYNVAYLLNIPLGACSDGFYNSDRSTHELGL